MLLSLFINGQATKVSAAYNSRGLARSNCFIGFYVDVTAFATGTYTFQLLLPSLPAGAFEGVFFENLVTDYSSTQVEAC
jgi:hypothetical protein